MENRFAFVVTISPGYMFPLNATLNAMKFYGTNADFYINYHAEMPRPYMEECSKAFPFKVIWNPLINRPPYEYDCLYEAFFADKYWQAMEIKDRYDAVCIIDGDLFLCANMNPYFEQAFNEKKFISATHEHSTFPVDSLYNMPPEAIVDRMYASLADFPVFFDPKHYFQFLEAWYKWTVEVLPPEIKDERCHPLIAFNRAIRSFIPRDKVIALDGNQWVCDKNYWGEEYRVKDNFMYNEHGQVFAIHNRWWADGRANHEFRCHDWVTDAHPDMQKSLLRGESNFNSIKNFMEFFNNMTPATYWDGYLKGPISKDAYRIPAP